MNKTYIYSVALLFKKGGTQIVKSIVFTSNKQESPEYVKDRAVLEAGSFFSEYVLDAWDINESVAVASVNQ